MLKNTVMLLSTLNISIYCMNENALIKTSDNQEFLLPQWKIESSRLLHTKQELQAHKQKYCQALSIPITLKTINSKALRLYSDALDTEDFTIYFKKLSSKKQNLLICTAGKEKLDCSYLTIQLLNNYFTPDLIKEHINPRISIKKAALCLQKLIILNNCEHKTFMQTTTKDYESQVTINGNGHYDILPNILTETKNFSGFSFPAILPISNELENEWLFENYIQPKSGNAYILTPTEPTQGHNNYAQWDERNNKKKYGTSISTQKSTHQQL